MTTETLQQPPLNRAQRRAACRQPAVQPRPSAAHPLALALFGVAKPQKQDIKQICDVLEAAFAAMRQGVATIGHWAVLGGAVDVAKAVEKQGVVRGLLGHIKATEQVLDSIYSRAENNGQWNPPELDFFEIDEIDNFIWLYKVQLERLSNAEYLRACVKAKNKINGSGGAKAIVVQDVGHFSVGAAA